MSYEDFLRSKNACETKRQGYFRRKFPKMPDEKVKVISLVFTKLSMM